MNALVLQIKNLIIASPDSAFTSDTVIFHVYINDKRLDEEYIMSEYDYHVCKDNMYCGPFVIPEDNYFMMGDNRGNSQDSRFWGTLPKDRFIGRAVFKFWPIKRVGVIE